MSNFSKETVFIQWADWFCQEADAKTELGIQEIYWQ